jgi:hypothetical protein
VVLDDDLVCVEDDVAGRDGSAAPHDREETFVPALGIFDGRMRKFLMLQR